MPQIEDDTPDAAYINDEIKAMYGSLADEGLLAVEAGEFPDFPVVDYEAYRSGPVLSLVIRTVLLYGHIEEYDTYIYDTEQGVQLFNDDLLAQKSMSEEQFLTEVRRAVVKASNKPEYAAWQEDGWDDMFPDCRERTAYTLSQNVAPDLPLYLDDSGTLYAVVPVATLAGSGVMEERLPLIPKDTKPFQDTVEFEDLFSLKISEKGLSIRFRDTAALAQLRETNACITPLKFDTDIPVHGLFLDYTKVQCGYLDSIATPYIFLLTEDGQLGYVDVAAGLQSGYFCASGPLLGLPSVAEVNPGLREDGCQTVYAYCENGEILDLYSLILTERYTVPTMLCGQWSTTITYETDGGGSYSNDVWLTLSEDGTAELYSCNFDVGTELRYSGSMSYMGTSEDGMVYAYTLWYEDEPYCSHQGAVAISSLWDDSGAVSELNIQIKELSGTGLFYTGSGETTVLTEIYG